jgi:hypothetical protein
LIQSGHLYFLHAWILFRWGETAPGFFKWYKKQQKPQLSDNTLSDPRTEQTSFGSKNASFMDMRNKLRKIHTHVAEALLGDADPEIMSERVSRRHSQRHHELHDIAKKRQNRSRSRTRLTSPKNIMFKSSAVYPKIKTRS